MTTNQNSDVYNAVEEKVKAVKMKQSVNTIEYLQEQFPTVPYPSEKYTSQLPYEELITDYDEMLKRALDPSIPEFLFCNYELRKDAHIWSQVYWSCTDEKELWTYFVKGIHIKLDENGNDTGLADLLIESRYSKGKDYDQDYQLRQLAANLKCYLYYKYIGVNTDDTKSRYMVWQRDKDMGWGADHVSPTAWWYGIFTAEIKQEDDSSYWTLMCVKPQLDENGDRVNKDTNAAIDEELIKLDSETMGVQYLSLLAKHFPNVDDES